MKLRVLGCSGAIASGCKTTSFLLDGRLLVDAGTGVNDLTLDEMVQVDHVLLTHSHLDHILSVGLLADSVCARRTHPVVVHALPATLKALKDHIFNDVIWPDFTRLPTPQSPVLVLRPIQVGQRLELAGLQIDVLPAEHTVPACGFAVQGQEGWWIFTGDTGPNPQLWPLLSQRRIKMLVIETAFSDQEIELARLSKHMAPSLLQDELAHIPVDVPVYLTHAKPGEMASIEAQVRQLDAVHRISHLEAGQSYDL